MYNRFVLFLDIIPYYVQLMPIATVAMHATIARIQVDTSNRIYLH